VVITGNSDSRDITSVRGRTIIVTGAGRGNGHAIATGLSQYGATVYGLDLAFAAGESPFTLVHCDLTDERAVTTALGTIVAANRPLDGLVNNAGISLPPENCYSRETFERTMAVNALAPLRLSWMTAEIMKRQSSGAIVNITSLGAVVGFPNNPAYQASKAALRQITKAMAVDYGQYGIRVNSISPGYMRTDMTKGTFNDPEARAIRSQRMILDRWGEPTDLVGACLFLLSDASAYVTGIDLPVDGGWLAKGL